MKRERIHSRFRALDEYLLQYFLYRSIRTSVSINSYCRKSNYFEGSGHRYVGILQWFPILHLQCTDATMSSGTGDVVLDSKELRVIADVSRYQTNSSSGRSLPLSVSEIMQGGIFLSFGGGGIRRIPRWPCCTG
jgi:hypothetical protein